MKEIRDAVLELIRLCSTDLPSDVEKALRQAHKHEKPGSVAHNILRDMLENVEIARRENVPLCQDTGTLIFYVNYPVEIKQSLVMRPIINATKMATRKNLLRPNSVDSVSGRNSSTNIGPGHPAIYFDQWNRKYLQIKLMLKGGGSENVGMQYSLPNSTLGAGRDLDGVKRCVIDAVEKAQGRGCPPGIVGVGIGGDRAGSYLLSEEQFFRKLNQRNPMVELDQLENELHQDLNKLGIGPMGLGGQTTVLGVKVGARNRIPASFFVSVSCMCWVCRRHTLILKNGTITYD